MFIPQIDCIMYDNLLLFCIIKSFTIFRGYCKTAITINEIIIFHSSEIIDFHMYKHSLIFIRINTHSLSYV